MFPPHSLLFDKKKTLMGIFGNISASEMPSNEVWPPAVTQLKLMILKFVPGTNRINR